jgi:hypothetical protein
VAAGAWGSLAHVVGCAPFEADRGFGGRRVRLLCGKSRTGTSALRSRQRS